MQVIDFINENRMSAQSLVNADGGPWRPASSFPELIGGGMAPMAPSIQQPPLVMPIGSPEDMSWIEKQFSQTSIVALVFFALCCGLIPLIFGLIGVTTCKNPTAKKNATIVLVISLIVLSLGAALRLSQTSMRP